MLISSRYKPAECLYATFTVYWNYVTQLYACQVPLWFQNSHAGYSVVSYTCNCKKISSAFKRANFQNALLNTKQHWTWAHLVSGPLSNFGVGLLLDGIEQGTCSLEVCMSAFDFSQPWSNFGRTLPSTYVLKLSLFEIDWGIFNWFSCILGSLQALVTGLVVTSVNLNFTLPPVYWSCSSPGSVVFNFNNLVSCVAFYNCDCWITIEFWFTICRVKGRWVFVVLCISRLTRPAFLCFC